MKFRAISQKATEKKFTLKVSTTNLNDKPINLK